MVAPAPWDELSPPAQRERLISDTWYFVHRNDLRVGEKRFPYDCSGLIGAVLYRNGIDVFGGASELDIRGNGVKILEQFVTRYGELFTADPWPGDIVFFSNTYDRNRDGKLNDELTHAALVERVDEDGTITFIHNVHRGVRRYVMNLRAPGRHKNGDGEIINSFLRRRRRSDGGATPYLAGSLFTGFGTLVRDRPLAVTRTSR